MSLRRSTSCLSLVFLCLVIFFKENSIILKENFFILKNKINILMNFILKLKKKRTLEISRRNLIIRFLVALIFLFFEDFIFPYTFIRVLAV
jgi:membrane-associated HD superfamily phosphohydrolase